MKTSNQKYRRRHWWKYTDWDNVGLIIFLVALIGGMVFGLVWAIIQSEKNSEANDSIVDSVQMDSVAVDSLPDSTLVADSVIDSVLPGEDSVTTKSDQADFDITIENTRIVIKTNRNIKVVIK